MHCNSHVRLWRNKKDPQGITKIKPFMYPKKNIYSAYVSKHNSDHEKQVILWMITNGERCKRQWWQVV